jgi:hypothetical protein
VSVSREIRYELRTFKTGELRRALERVRTQVCPETVIKISRVRSLLDGTTKMEHDLPLTALDDICDLAHENQTIRVEFVVEFPTLKGIFKSRSRITLQTFLDRLSADVDANEPEELDALFSALENALALSRWQRKPESEDSEEDDPIKRMGNLLADITDRVKQLENTSSRQSITCFLSYQFSGISRDYGRLVKEFLEELSDIRVVTGEGYEPRTIQDKVRSRLAGIDVVVLIEVAERRSVWTRDEIARTQTPGVFFIPLVEKGAAFEPGIYGEHEHISFAQGHVSDAFLGLLQGINYVRRTMGEQRDVVRAPPRLTGDSLGS